MKSTRNHPRVACGLGLLLILSGCSGGSGLFGKSDSNTAHDFGLTRDWNLSMKEEPKFRAVQASDLVGEDGHCATDGAAPSSAMRFQAGPDASRGGAPSAALPPPAAPPVPRGIGLGMTECEVVNAAGPTDKVEISSTEGGARKVVLTYPRGDHADLYQFEAGRLKSIQRIALAQAAEKPGNSRRRGSGAAGN